MIKQTYISNKDFSGIVKLLLGDNQVEKAYYSSCNERKRLIAKWHEQHALSTQNFELRILPN